MRNLEHAAQRAARIPTRARDAQSVRADELKVSTRNRWQRRHRQDGRPRGTRPTASPLSENSGRISSSDRVVESLRVCARLDLERVQVDSFDLVERAVGPHLLDHTVEGLAEILRVFPYGER